MSYNKTNSVIMFTVWKPHQSYWNTLIFFSQKWKEAAVKMFGAFTSACCMKLRMLFFVVLTSCMLCLTQHHGAGVLSSSDVTTLVPGADDIIPCSGPTQHISFMKPVKSDIIDRVNESSSVYFGLWPKKPCCFQLFVKKKKDISRK